MNFRIRIKRQREVILALAGDQAKGLFLVGDAQQSIYRFRGADVEVFVEMQDLIHQRGGVLMILETTFRSHKSLLDGIDSLLIPVISDQEDRDRPFKVPYVPMTPFAQEYSGRYEAPFIEFVLGAGEDAEDGRRVSAQALAERLLKMRNAGEITSWNEVVLLFRATSGYQYYEEAFARASLPYVTVAGKGFFDRPEIRDLLNILIALSEPWNEAAMVGFLRSPAIGLKDASLLRLHSGEEEIPYFKALEEYEVLLPEDEHPHALWASQILEEFVPLIDHLTIAEILDRLVNHLNYRAILMVGGMRLVNNLDKLIDDARQSNLVQVSAFLDYLRARRDVGVRTGEAPREVQDSYQLMTIHKSKGLEFPLVVLADAAHGGSNQQPVAIISPGVGLSIRLGNLESQSMLFNYSRLLDQEREQAEADRLLYVAATRAQEKLIISGHCTSKGSTRGNLKKLGCGVPGRGGDPKIDLTQAIDNPGRHVKVRLDEKSEIGLVIYTEGTLTGGDFVPKEKRLEKTGASSYLINSLSVQPARSEKDFEDESQTGQRDWRATKGHYAPAVVVGQLVHKALQRWVFPGDEEFDLLVNSGLIREGIVDQEQRDIVVQETSRLVQR